MSSVDIFNKSGRGNTAPQKNSIFGTSEDREAVNTSILDTFDQINDNGVPRTRGEKIVHLGNNIVGLGGAVAYMGVEAIKKPGGIIPGVAAFAVAGALMYGGTVLSQYGESIDVSSPFHLMDPEKLNFNDSESGRNSKETYRLLDTETVKDFSKEMQEMNERLEKTMDSVKETRESLHDGRDNLGTLADRGIGEKRESHLSGKLS